MNPHGRIPVLVDGDLVVWESHTILRYLAAVYGSGLLWSESPAVRSLSDRWMDWSLATLQPAFMRLFWGFFRTPEGQRDAAAVRHALEACGGHYRLLDAELATRPFLGGARFGLADIPAATTLYRYFEMGAPVERPPHVAEWYARVTAREAYRRHVMVSFEALRGRLGY